MLTGYGSFRYDGLRSVALVTMMCMYLLLAISVILPVCLAMTGAPPLMRPRPGVSRCDLEDRKASIQCVMQCIHDPCCLAVTVTAQCDMAYIPADASNMDLIKEVSHNIIVTLLRVTHTSHTYPARAI